MLSLGGQIHAHHGGLYSQAKRLSIVSELIPSLQLSWCCHGTGCARTCANPWVAQDPDITAIVQNQIEEHMKWKWGLWSLVKALYVNKQLNHPKEEAPRFQELETHLAAGSQHLASEVPFPCSLRDPCLPSTFSYLSSILGEVKVNLRVYLGILVPLKGFERLKATYCTKLVTKRLRSLSAHRGLHGLPVPTSSIRMLQM